MSKVLWLGDAGCHTGFARVTHAIGERLVRDYGHEVHVIATNYDGDPWDTNLKLYVPTIKDRTDIFGQSRFIELRDYPTASALSFTLLAIVLVLIAIYTKLLGTEEATSAAG